MLILQLESCSQNFFISLNLLIYQYFDGKMMSPRTSSAGAQTTQITAHSLYPVRKLIKSVDIQSLASSKAYAFY